MGPNIMGYSAVIIYIAITLFLPLHFTSAAKKAPHKKAGTTSDSRPDPKPVPGLKFLGWANSEAIFIGEKAIVRDEAWKHCEKAVQATGYAGHLATIVKTNKKQIFDLLKSKADKEQYLWIAHWIQTIDGKEIMLRPGSSGTEKEDVTGMGLTDDMSRRKRGLVSHSRQSRQLVASVRGKRDDEGTASDFATRATQVTIKESHYPWISNNVWGQPGGNNCNIGGCKPRNCKTTTKPCNITTKPCKVEKPKCELVDSGPCTARCEQCSISQPNCWMGKTECDPEEERKCRVEPPICTVVTPTCTVTRLPCVTKNPECHIEETEQICHVNSTCPTGNLGSQGLSCVKLPRECTEKEMEAGKKDCHYVQCDPQLLCLKPAVCTKPSVRCPYPKTFCPPETVHCPQPFVNCSEPTIICQDPKFNCPYPEVFCEEPKVNCSAPRIVCPPTITKCGHPSISCPPPEVTCPEGEVECDPPEPCPVNPDRPPCAPPTAECTTADTSCTCVALKKLNQPTTSGDWYQERGALCDQLVKPLCQSGVPKGSSG